MLGHGHGGIGGLAAHQRRRIRGGDDDDRPRQPCRAQIVLEEFPHLAPALADQGEHGDVARGVAGQHGQQHRLADAGTGEQAEPLALAAGGEALSARTPRSSRGPAGRAASRRAARRARGRGNGAGQAAAPRPSSGRPSGSITRPSHSSATASVPPPPASRWARNTAATLPGPSPSSVRKWHCLGQTVAETDDLRRDARAVARRQEQPVADGDIVRPARRYRPPARRGRSRDPPTWRGEARATAMRRSAATFGQGSGCLIEADIPSELDSLMNSGFCSGTVLTHGRKIHAKW